MAREPAATPQGRAASPAAPHRSDRSSAGSGRSVGDGIAYSEVDLNVLAAHKRAIATRRFKLIRDDVSGKIELYDLTRDPHERQDVADRLPDVVESLLRELERRIALAPPGLVTPGKRSFSEADLMGLRSLGYIE